MFASVYVCASLHMCCGIIIVSISNSASVFVCELVQICACISGDCLRCSL